MDKIINNNRMLSDEEKKQIKIQTKKYMQKEIKKQIKFKSDMNWCMKHIRYYEFLKNKINKKDKTHVTLLNTIRTYDYDSPVWFHK